MRLWPSKGQGDEMKIGKIIAVLILMSMVIPTTMLVMGDVEPNDDFEHAELIGAGTHTGTVSDYYDTSFNEHKDIDYYKVQVPSGKAVLISLTGESGKTVTLEMYNEEKQDVYEMAHSTDGALDRAFYDGKSSQQYIVYAKVYTLDNMANYTIKVEFRPSDIMSSATQINENQKVSETLYSVSEVHWYKITVPAGKKLNLSVTSKGDDVWVSLYKEDGTLVNIDHGTSFSIAGSNTHDTSITAYIKVSSLSTNKVSYTFTPKFQDIGSGGGGNSSGGSSPFVGAPLLLLAVLLVMAMMWVRKRKETS